MSTSLWDWAAVLSGLWPDERIFLPSYWVLPANLTVPFGWAPEPWAVLSLLIAVSFAGLIVCLRSQRTFGLHLAAVIWGSLLADTPYAILLPLFVWGVCKLAILVASKVLKRKLVSAFRIPWLRLFLIYALAFAGTGVCNFTRSSWTYLRGYVGNARAALTWSGGWHPWTEMAMDAILNDYVAEIAREADDRQWILTDGLCDAGIELATARRHRQGLSFSAARAISIAGWGRDESYWRSRGIGSEEDLAALTEGPAGLLRSWAVDRPENLHSAVFLCGFSFLDREAAGKLVTSGLVLCDRRCPQSERDRAAEALRMLGSRIVEFYKLGGDPQQGGAIRSARFCSMQWRVARALRRQAGELDREVRTDEALARTALSERLDKFNPYARKNRGTTETADMKAFGSLTPREGLAFALRRANFTLARQFALPVVQDDPENAEANFALAMSHMALKEYAQARHYFALALKARPNDAALLNNIAVASMMLGDLKEAEAKANAALEALPGSPEIQDTLKRIEERKAKAESESE